jgi:hypothetical protein
MYKSLIIVLFVFLYNNSYGQESSDFFNLQWRDFQTEIDEAHVGDKIIIEFETRNILDNEIIDIEIWEETDGKLMDLIKKLQGTIKRSIVELEWIVEFDENNENTNYAREIEEIGYTFIDYVFLVKYEGITISSKALAISSWIDQLIVNQYGEPVRNQDFVIMILDKRTGKVESIVGKTNDEGHMIMRNLRKIGRYRLLI